MTSSLIDNLRDGLNLTTTENGAKTYKSTHSALLDFFSLAGAMRNRPQDALDLFKRAYAEDKQYAIRTLFYLRDIRGGQGERLIFRTCLEWLKENEIAQLAQHIPEYGRWDEVLCFQDNAEVQLLVRKTYQEDLANAKAGKPISLLAKWLPSENASSKDSIRAARKWAKILGLDAKQYRKNLSFLRGKINLVETALSNKKCSSIQYRSVPSQAFKTYLKAFRRNDEARFEEFITKVSKGEEKVNAGTLFPYEILEKLTRANEAEMNILWDALPDYTRGNNAIVMADTSGSMVGRPIATSVSLALYFAERNKGQFKDYFLTFSGEPELVHVPESMSFADKVHFMCRASWGYNTDLHRAFRTILDIARQANTPADEMPTTLYVISDMEFDSCVSNSRTNYEAIEDLYKASGYELPTVVFWNVNARQNQAPALSHNPNVALVSGSSPSTFKMALEHKTPGQVMLDVLDSERYSKICI